MAIDTREKRMNAMGVGRPWHRSHHTETIDEQWRIAAGNAYGGNALSPAAGRIMFSMVGPGGLVRHGGIAGHGGGLAG